MPKVSYRGRNRAVITKIDHELIDPNSPSNSMPSTPVTANNSSNNPFSMSAATSGHDSLVEENSGSSNNNNNVNSAIASTSSSLLTFSRRNLHNMNGFNDINNLLYNNTTQAKGFKLGSRRQDTYSATWEEISRRKKIETTSLSDTFVARNRYVFALPIQFVFILMDF